MVGVAAPGVSVLVRLIRSGRELSRCLSAGLVPPWRRHSEVAISRRGEVMVLTAE